MNTPEDVSKLSMEQLKEEWTALYQVFLPTFKSYTELASRAVALQSELARRELSLYAFPGAGWIKAGFVCKYNAREKPDTLEKLIAEAKKNNINVTHIVSDPLRHDFYLFGEHE